MAQQLLPTFYDASCPNLQSIVRSGMAAAVQQEPRMGASILRLFFHDCFVQAWFREVIEEESSMASSLEQVLQCNSEGEFLELVTMALDFCH